MKDNGSWPATRRFARRATFRQLEIFDAAARLGSYSRAAESLHLSQPTVSMQLRKLADAVGEPLFEQVGKQIYLTAAGRELQKTCSKVFRMLDEFEIAVADMQGLKRGTLRVAAVTTAEYFAPRILGRFCQLHPGVEVALEITNREHVLERLVANQDDLYVFGQPPQELEVESVPFMENELVVIAPRSHRLTSCRRISLERIANQPFLLREPGSGTRSITERVFRERNLHLKVRMELGSNEAIKQAVAGGLGLSVLSRITLPAADDSVAILPVEGFPLKRHWYLVYPRGKNLSAVAQAFLDFAVEQRAAEPPDMGDEAGSMVSGNTAGEQGADH